MEIICGNFAEEQLIVFLLDWLLDEWLVSESDNLGSTDSEVKKILTLHLPISEYDTLGSDSEGDARATSQELMSFSQRMRGELECVLVSL